MVGFFRLCQYFANKRKCPEDDKEDEGGEVDEDDEVTIVAERKRPRLDKPSEVVEVGEVILELSADAVVVDLTEDAEVDVVGEAPVPDLGQEAKHNVFLQSYFDPPKDVFKFPFEPPAPKPIDCQAVENEHIRRKVRRHRKTKEGKKNSKKVRESRLDKMRRRSNRRRTRKNNSMLPGAGEGPITQISDEPRRSKKRRRHKHKKRRCKKREALRRLRELKEKEETSLAADSEQHQVVSKR